jgi:hypothetical protein
MITKETILKLERQLRYGDKRRIASRSGISAGHVVRFFNAETDKVSPELQEKIVEHTNALLEERIKKARALGKKADAITANL